LQKRQFDFERVFRRVCSITPQHERKIGNFAYGIAVHWHAAERGLERVNREGAMPRMAT
jgi:hypothetical protein